MQTSQHEIAGYFDIFDRSLMISRGGSRTAATSKMERFVIIVNGSRYLSQSTPSWMLQQS